MNMIKAAEDTMKLARPYFTSHPVAFEQQGTSCSPTHLETMLEKMQAGDMSEGKLGRWLGWMQCAIVAADVGVTLEDMKNINKKYADETHIPGRVLVPSEFPDEIMSKVLEELGWSQKEMNNAFLVSEWTKEYKKIYELAIKLISERNK